MNREEMVEWLISKEPGNPKLRRFVDRKLYATDNSRTIDLLMMHAHELAERVRNLGGIWSSEDVMSVADAIDPKVEK